MADNVDVTPGTGATIATDDVSGVQYQRVKIDLGGDGAASPLVRGQQSAANSLPVTLPSDQGALAVTGTFWQTTQPVSGPLTDTQLRASAVPISASALPLPSGAATAAKQPALGTAGSASADVITVQGVASMTALKVDGSAVTQPVSDGGGSLTVDGTVAVTDGGGSITVDAAALPLPTGAATEATLAGLLAQSDFDTKVGSLTETAPANDTASSGLNGRLQRIAQRLTSLIALVPAALGQTTKSASLAVTVASDDDLQSKVGATNESAAAGDTSTSGLNGLFKRLLQRVTTLLAVFPTTIDTNSGNKSASTLRVVLATDQPQLTAKLLVTPDANSAVNVAQINGVTPLMGNGASGTGAQRVTIANDSTGILAGVTGAAAVAHDAVGTSVNPMLMGGYASAAAPADVSADGDAVRAWRLRNGAAAVVLTAAGNLMTAGAGAVGAGTPRVTLASDDPAVAALSNPTSVARLLSAAASTNGTNVKNGAGRVFTIVGTNQAGGARYLKLYNKASSPTVGTDTPVATFQLPALQSFAIDIPRGLTFATGISYALTTAAADADTGALTAGDVTCLNILYA